MRAWLLTALSLGLLLVAPTALAEGGEEEAAAGLPCHVDVIDRPPYVVIWGCISYHLPPIPPVPPLPPAP